MMNYSYFGRVDKWSDGLAAAGQDGSVHKIRSQLVGKKLDATHIIMSGVLNYWNTPTMTDGQWEYNHGVRKWASVFNDGGGNDYDEPEFAGLNQLYGDGHVEWKSASEMDVVDMLNPFAGYDDGFVGFNGRAGLPYGFY